MSTLQLPGLIDIHTHLRDPGLVHKEDLASGTRAAVAGGITMLLDMPNNLPPTTNPKRLREKIVLARQKALCDIGFFVGATNEAIGAYLPVAEQACGLKIYVNETFGNLRIDTLNDLHQIFRGWAEVGERLGYRAENGPGPGIGPIAVHAEEMMVPVCVALASLYDVPLHVVHVSRKSEIEVIARAKERGRQITCEVTPHHLLLTLDDATRLGVIADMRPKLATAADVQALWDNLAYVDAFATDHAPHTLAEKQGPKPPPGIPGLESMLPLLLRQVHEGRLELQDIILRCSERPRQIYGLPEQQDTFIEVDVDHGYVLDPAQWHSKARWSPFAGQNVFGRVERVVIRGHTLVSAGNVTATDFISKVVFNEPTRSDKDHES